MYKTAKFWIDDTTEIHSRSAVQSCFSRRYLLYCRLITSLTYFFGQTAVTRAVGLLLLSVKTSNPLFVHKNPWSEWIGGNKGSLAHPTRMPQAARRDRYGFHGKKIRISTNFSIYLSIYLSLSVCLSVYLSVF